MAVILHTTLKPTKLELLTSWLPSRPWYRGGMGGPKLAKAGGFRLDDPQGAVGIEFMVVNDVPGPHPTAPPRGAAGHVASRWQMPDGNYVRGLFAVLYKPLVATAV